MFSSEFVFLSWIVIVVTKFKFIMERIFRHIKINYNYEKKFEKLKNYYKFLINFVLYELFPKLF